MNAIASAALFFASGLSVTKAQAIASKACVKLASLESMFWLLYPSGKKRSKFYFSTHILDSYLLLLTFISELPHPSQQIIVERSVIRSSKWLGEIFKLGALIFFLTWKNNGKHYIKRFWICFYFPVSIYFISFYRLSLFLLTMIVHYLSLQPDSYICLFKYLTTAAKIPTDANL